MGNPTSFDDWWQALDSEADSAPPMFATTRETINRQAFRHAVLAAADTVQNRGWQVVGLHTQDSFTFVVGFCGIVLAGAVPAVLPHAQTGFISGLAGDIDGLLTDHDIPEELCNVVIQRLAMAAQLPSPLPQRAWPKDPRFSFWTSGSSRHPKCITKPLRAMAAEVAALEAHFAPGMPDTFGGTISHQHYYGATFRIFWPLLTGRCIWRPLLRYPSEVTSAPSLGIAIASSPTFLVESLDLLDAEALLAHKVKMFSSGAPLPLAVAQRLNAGASWLVTEILGSTETGAVASRLRQGATPEDAWSALPGVELLVEGERILVRSAGTGVGKAVELGDSGTLATDGRLHLLGRRDKIVKVREKRVSLTAVEENLLAHPFVREVAALTLERHQLTELGVAIAPTDAGFAALENEGHRGFSTILQQHLAHSLDPTTLPKRWRFVRTLPRNSMAKVTQAALQALFADTAAGMQRSLPEIFSDSCDDSARVLDLRIGDDLKWFEGHFPEFPVLPGVVQIDWVAHFAAPLVSDGLTFQRMRGVKFTNILQPGMSVCLTLKYDSDKQSLNFAFTGDQGSFSSGRFLYA